MPVREATQRLVAEKALEIGTSRIIRVPTMTVAQFREITSIRINFEGFAVEQACCHMNKKYLTEIEALNKSFNQELDLSNPDGTKLISINKDLHFAIYKASEMPMLLQLIEALWLRIGPILNYDLRTGSKRLEARAGTEHHTRMVKTLSHHCKLVKALKERDPRCREVGTTRRYFDRSGIYRLFWNARYLAVENVWLRPWGESAGRSICFVGAGLFDSSQTEGNTPPVFANGLTTDQTVISSGRRSRLALCGDAAELESTGNCTSS